MSDLDWLEPMPALATQSNDEPAVHMDVDKPGDQPAVDVGNAEPVDKARRAIPISTEPRPSPCIHSHHITQTH